MSYTSGRSQQSEHFIVFLGKGYGSVNPNNYPDKAYQVNIESAGWRYGYVALKKDGTRVYGKLYSAKSGKATFKTPADCSDLWFVVLGAPTNYWMHAWDDKTDNDEQWPYKVKFNGTNIFGAIDFKASDKPQGIV